MPRNAGARRPRRRGATDRRGRRRAGGRGSWWAGSRWPARARRPGARRRRRRRRRSSVTAGDGARDELDVLALERRIERRREDQALAPVGIRRRDRRREVGPVGELAVDVAAAELLLVGVDLRARPVGPRHARGSSRPATAGARRSKRHRSGGGVPPAPRACSRARLSASPNPGSRWKRRTATATSAISGTICAALEPVPTTATRLPVRSCSCSHRAVWNAGPRKVSRPGQSGMRGTLRNPTALISTWHVVVVPSSSSTCRCASLRPTSPCRRRRRCGGAGEDPNSSTTSSRYFRSSACLACVRVHRDRERERIEARRSIDLAARIRVVAATCRRSRATSRRS